MKRFFVLYILAFTCMTAVLFCGIEASAANVSGERISTSAQARQDTTRMLALRSNLLYDLFYMPEFGFAPMWDIQAELYPHNSRYSLIFEFTNPYWQKWDQHKFFQFREKGDYTGLFTSIYGENSVFLESVDRSFVTIVGDEKATIDDADLTLQPSRSASNLAWVGIGNSTHMFNGTLIGSSCTVSRLKSSSLFVSLWVSARVEDLVLRDVINPGAVAGTLAGTNDGVIAACFVDSDVSTTSSAPSGALVGTNSGNIYASYHVGSFSGSQLA